MVNKIVHGTYTETYDLNTALNELSILGIHTPQAHQLKNMFRGFFEQYKKFKILGCNLQMVCASQQSLTPDLVGTETGLVDPRDVLNPILFKACTGDNLNVLLNQIYNYSEENPALYDNGSIGQHTDTSSEAINAYYQLLADDSWRKSHPQAGLTVSHLIPMVHKVVTTQPFKWNVAPFGTSDTSFKGGAAPSFGGVSGPLGPSSAKGFGAPSAHAMTDDINALDSVNPTVFISNGITEMPWLDTSYQANDLQLIAGTVTPDETEYGLLEKSTGEHLCANVPRVYMGAIVLPPAKLQKLYFRMRVTWHVEFKDFRPAFELQGYNHGFYHDNYGAGMDVDTNYGTYFNMYHDASKLNKEFSSFDANGIAEVDMINQSVA